MKGGDLEELKYIQKNSFNVFSEELQMQSG